MSSQLLAIKQKRAVFLHRIWRPGKLWNIFKSFARYYTGSEKIKTYPLLVKIDVSPLCQLKCPVCIHSAEQTEAYSQDFKNKWLDFELFKKVTDELAGKTLAFSMYHLGEPLLNKDIYKMITYANSKGINCYFTSNFSLKISDEEMEALVRSGVRQVLVALDGFTQENYGRTRVKGNVEWVKENLRKITDTRKRLGVKDIFVSVQTCKFEHNAHEMPEIEAFCKEIGVDEHRIFPGVETPGGWIAVAAPRMKPKKASALPKCKWPFFASVMLYNGETVPCCQYRNDNAYSTVEETISMGSVQTGSFRSVFNGDTYATARKMMSTPDVDEKKAKENFCYQCPIIFE